MTSRLVASAALARGAGAPWTSTLRACGAYEAFLRTYRGLETERAAAEFLLLDRLFPRSVVFALNRAEQCLDNLESSPAGRLPERGAAAARPDARGAGVPLAVGPDDRPARRRWSGSSSPSRPPPRRSPAATSPGRKRWPGRGSRGEAMSMQHRIVHTTRLRVRRQGGRVVQPGPADPGDHARADRGAQPARGVAEAVDLRVPRLLRDPGHRVRGGRPARLDDGDRDVDGAVEPDGHATSRPRRGRSSRPARWRTGGPST